MTQPEFVPITKAEKVRPAEEMEIAEGWVPNRPAEIRGVTQPRGPMFGTAGPDQGYALKLFRRFEPRLQLQEGEKAHDVIAGSLGVALRRARAFGRAPVIHDVEHSLTIWGFLGDAPKELEEYRKPLFQAVGHSYHDQREIVDRVPEATLRLSPAEVREQLANWRQLISI